MKQRQITIRPSDRTGAAVILAVLLATASLTVLSADPQLWPRAAIAILIVGIPGLVVRHFRANEAVVLSLEASLAVLIATALALTAKSVNGGLVDRVVALTTGAFEHIRTEVAPMPSHEGVLWVAVLFVALLYLMADVLVHTLAHPSWVFVVLITVYLIPALGITTEIAWSSFALMLLGYFGVLIAESINHSRAWSRHLLSDSASGTVGARPAFGIAAVILVPLLVLTFGLGQFLPNVTDSLWRNTRPGGQQPIQLSNPRVDLHKNLTQPNNRMVLTYKTDAGHGLYLRQTSLSAFDETGWHMSAMQLRSGVLSTPPGIAAKDYKTVKTEIQVGDLRGQYLLSPYPPRVFKAAGQWSYDPTTLTIVSSAGNGDRAIRNLDYSIESLDVIPEGQKLVKATVDNAPERQTTTQLPAQVPQAIYQLALEITKDEPTPALKAAALQEYLRSSKFTYSLSAPTGKGYDWISDFLTGSKRGYCVHYATAFALMARAVGIPARVAIGFSPGQKAADHYEVRINNAHMWPELYFDGFGWLRYEPTASIGGPPPWSQTIDIVPEATPSPNPTAAPSSAKPSAQTPTPSATTSTAPKAGGSGFDWWLPIRVLLGIAFLLALLGAPAGVRLLLYARRHGAASSDERAVGAWEELQDLRIDLGFDWPAGTIEQVRQELVATQTQPVSEAISRVASSVQEHHYARDVSANETIREDLRFVRSQWLANAPIEKRVLAIALPRSLARHLQALLRRITALRPRKADPPAQPRRKAVPDEVVEQFSPPGSSAPPARGDTGGQQPPRFGDEEGPGAY